MTDQYSHISDEDQASLRAAPDPVMDAPTVSAFWRRRAALALGLHDWPNVPWVDCISVVEHREYQRDTAWAGAVAVRNARIAIEVLKGEIETARRELTQLCNATTDDLSLSTLIQMIRVGLREHQLDCAIHTTTKEQ